MCTDFTFEDFLEQIVREYVDDEDNRHLQDAVEAVVYGLDEEEFVSLAQELYAGIAGAGRKEFLRFEPRRENLFACGDALCCCLGTRVDLTRFLAAHDELLRAQLALREDYGLLYDVEVTRLPEQSWDDAWTEANEFVEAHTFHRTEYVCKERGRWVAKIDRGSGLHTSLFLGRVPVTLLFID